jgi:hypothetical protein
MSEINPFNPSVSIPTAAVGLKFRKGADTPIKPVCQPKTIVNTQNKTLVSTNRCAPASNGSIELYVDVIPLPPSTDPLQGFPNLVYATANYSALANLPKKNIFTLYEHASNFLDRVPNNLEGIWGGWGYLGRRLPFIVDPTSPCGLGLGVPSAGGVTPGIQYGEQLFNPVPLFGGGTGWGTLPGVIFEAPMAFAGGFIVDTPLTHNWPIDKNPPYTWRKSKWEPLLSANAPPDAYIAAPLGHPRNRPFELFNPFNENELYTNSKDHFGVPRALILTPGKVYRFIIECSNWISLGGFQVIFPDYVYIDLVCGPCE